MKKSILYVLAGLLFLASCQDMYFVASKKLIEEKYPDLNIDIKDGKQNVYSFLISVE